MVGCHLAGWVFMGLMPVERLVWCLGQNKPPVRVTCWDPYCAGGRGENTRVRSPRTDAGKFIPSAHGELSSDPGPKDATVAAIGSAPKGLLHRNQCSFLPPGASLMLETLARVCRRTPDVDAECCRKERNAGDRGVGLPGPRVGVWGHFTPSCSALDDHEPSFNQPVPAATWKCPRQKDPGPKSWLPVRWSAVRTLDPDSYLKPLFVFSVGAS